MSFSAASLFLMLLVIGELSTFSGQGVPPPLSSPEAVQNSLTKSCQVLTSEGPLAGLEIGKLIEFQRQSLERLKRRRLEFIERNCRNQQDQFLGRRLREELLTTETGSSFWLERIARESQPMGPLFQRRDGSATDDDLRTATDEKSEGPLRQDSDFVCDTASAESEFAQQFGHGTQNPLDEQLKIFPDLGVEQLITFWDAFCVDDPKQEPPGFIPYESLLENYNQILAEVQEMSLEPIEAVGVWPQGTILDDQGQPIGGLMRGGRVVTDLPINQIPESLKRAFIAAEDKNFYQHRGVEIQGILRGFLKYMRDGSIEGGSTITQQLVKNLLLTSEISLDRKAKEMLLARRVEDRFSKDEILGAYLNIIYLGRGSRGVRAAMDRYFGEDFRLEDLSLGQASFLAGITHSPNRYNPSFIDEAVIRSRQSYVLDELIKMEEITEAEKVEIQGAPLGFQPLRFPKLTYFQAAASQEFASRLSSGFEESPVQIASTQNQPLQEQVDQLLQKRLADFEMRTGRVIWQGPLRNISYLWERGSQDPVQKTQLWQAELIKTQSLFAGVNWSVGVVLKTGQEMRVGVVQNDQTQIGLLRLNEYSAELASSVMRKLQVGDVVFVEPKLESFHLRIPPLLQGAVVVMDALTGEIKALSGGFDYSLTPFDRARLSRRQPGSTVKPFVYLAALENGLKPTSPIPNRSLVFPSSPGCSTWSPRNYSGTEASSVPLETGLVRSFNQTTAQLLFELSPNPESSLHYIFELMKQAGLYESSTEQGPLCFPLILGSRETSLLNLATAYASLANGGWRVTPTFLKTTEAKRSPLTTLRRSSLVALTGILAKVVSQGTGTALNEHRGRVAGKTGTSSDYRDAWFVGYSNRHVVVAWMGYDQSRQEIDGRTYELSLLGSTGGRLVAPMVNEIFRALFDSSPGQPLDEGRPLVASVEDYELEDPALYGGLSSSPIPDLPSATQIFVEDATESDPTRRLEADLPEEQQPSPELRELLHEDSWQRLRSRREELLQRNQDDQNESED